MGKDKNKTWDIVKSNLDRTAFFCRGAYVRCRYMTYKATQVALGELEQSCRNIAYAHQTWIHVYVPVNICTVQGISCEETWAIGVCVCQKLQFPCIHSIPLSLHSYLRRGELDLYLYCPFLYDH
jgi:hypothetical protein